MSLISKPYDFSGMTGKCHNCGKKLPKKLAYWCNISCYSKLLDKQYRKIKKENILNTKPDEATKAVKLRMQLDAMQRKLGAMLKTMTTKEYNEYLRRIE